MQRWLLMVCLLPCLRTNAQNPHGRAKEKYAIIFVEPLAALDYSNGQSIRAGAEYRLGRQWSVSATGGVYLQEGYIVRTELKWLMPGVNELNFISLEYEYISHLYTQKDFYKKYDSARGYTVDDESRPRNYTTDKHIHQINLTYGYDEFWRHHWMFEVYGGLGIKFKTTSRDISESEIDQLYHYHESMIRNIGSQEGKFVTFALSIGIKFGRVFTRH